jgi:small neutral amino acid transporter SnatA (MarC family)
MASTEVSKSKPILQLIAIIAASFLFLIVSLIISTEILRTINLKDLAIVVEMQIAGLILGILAYKK